MILRPVDASGDILPVSSSSDLLSGPEAVARLAAYKLSAGMFASRVTEFIRSVEGVFEVDDVQFQIDGRVFRYSCQLLTEEGPAALEYTFD